MYMQLKSLRIFPTETSWQSTKCSFNQDTSIVIGERWTMSLYNTIQSFQLLISNNIIVDPGGRAV